MKRPSTSDAIGPKRKRIRNAAITAFLAAGLVIANVAPAYAADAWIYVIVNKGACPSGSEPRGILAAVPQAGFSSPQWDNGDNIVYVKTRAGQRNQVIAQVRCEKRVALFFWQTTGYRTISAYITPTTSGSSFWIG